MMTDGPDASAYATRFRGKTVAITGAGAGIGLALARRFLAAGAVVAISDRDGALAERMAADLGCFGMECDVADGTAIAAFIEHAAKANGPIDLFCSNAGILIEDTDPGNVAGAPVSVWQRSWDINVMAHVHAARLLVPEMRARGGGTLVQIVSAAGLLTQLGSAPYSVTKHAALGFAENLAIMHRADRIHVAAVCPEVVDTAMGNMGPADHPARHDGVLSPDVVAHIVLEGLARGDTLILPHPQVAGYIRAKAEDHGRWISVMAKLAQRLG